MRRIVQVLVLAVLSESAVSGMAVTNELAQSAAEKPGDVQLQTAIAEAMHTSPLTANSLIVVHVNQGEVTLEGTAMSPLARREATRLAETVLGVKSIRNRLSVLNTQTAEIPPEK
jgi:osmotically-inducible protein OsmY